MLALLDRWMVDAARQHKGWCRWDCWRAVSLEIGPRVAVNDAEGSALPVEMLDREDQL